MPIAYTNFRVQWMFPVLGAQFLAGTYLDKKGLMSMLRTSAKCGVVRIVRLLDIGIAIVGHAHAPRT